MTKSNLAPDSDNDVDTTRKSYDIIAADYTAWVESRPSLRLHYLEMLLSRLPTRSSVLELGCGAGVPVTEALARNEKVQSITANDFSSSQIALAKKRLSSTDKVQLIEGDMSALLFSSNSFDGVVAFYSVFHLHREHQPAMHEKVFEWLKPGGIFLANFATTNESTHRGKFFGSEMAWSSWSVEESKRMVETAGFDVLQAEVRVESEDGQLGESDPDYGISFLWIVAKKRTFSSDE
jgi:ubiquinone/menaquinone biosynthesis C-methylase UbiE